MAEVAIMPAHSLRLRLTLLLILCVSALSGRAAQLPLLPAQFPQAAAQETLDWDALRPLYAAHAGPYLWHDAAAVARQPLIDSLLQAVDLAVAHGLPASRYHDRRLVRETDPARRDLLLSDALLKLVSDMGRGRDAAHLERLWHLPRPQLDPVAQALQALQGSAPLEVVRALAPDSAHYRQLVELYQRYRVLAREPLPALSAARLIEPGDQHPAIAGVRQHLVRLGDAARDEIALATAPDLYDQPLVAAVRRFQARHGLQPDGIIGPKTLAELNRPLSERLAQLRGNLERWRWMPRQLGERHILVSTAGYFLDLVEQDRIVFHTRTITGRPHRPTPSFRSDLTRLTVNPNWTVPRRIMREDLLPQIRKDPNWLAANRMEVGQYVDGRWQAVDPASVDWQQPGSVFLRQAPGPGNALGRLKFGMDNPFSIYLHDTPAQSLFEQPLRPFSSGCVRVQGIQVLVSRLLEGNAAMLEWYGDALAQTHTEVRRLPEPVPVYLVYLSAWVDADGQAQFRPDIYGLDRPLQARLEQAKRQRDRQLAVY
jgi:murein L,D-transpeptidase YcbB/YkuD